MPIDNSEFYPLRENVELTFREFERNMGRESEGKLLEAMRSYTTRVPREVRMEIAREKGDEMELVFAARLRLDQYYNACFCDK